MTSENFDAQSIGLRAQKKWLSKMSSRKVIGAFIDDTSGRLLDNLYRIAKEYADKKTAEKVIKNLIKSIVKTGILYRNDQLNSNELTTAEDFKRKFRQVAMTIVSFYTVDFTYDRNFLVSSLAECGELLKKIVVRHLTEKSIGRIDHVFNFFSNQDFLDTIFRQNGPHHILMTHIVDDLSKLIDSRVL